MHGTEASRKLGVYFRALLEERRREPGDDLVSLLAQAQADGDVLPEEVLVSFLRQLVNAGGDTTYRATSILLTGLLTHPAQLDAVRRDRSLIPQAIEEALRWDGPVLVARRSTTRPILLQGAGIPEGAIIDVASGSAHRDPTRYPGSGLGLVICRHLIEAHGGRIWAESEPGRGSRFVFLLP